MGKTRIQYIWSLVIESSTVEKSLPEDMMMEVKPGIVATVLTLIDNVIGTGSVILGKLA